MKLWLLVGKDVKYIDSMFYLNQSHLLFVLIFTNPIQIKPWGKAEKN